VNTITDCGDDKTRDINKHMTKLQDEQPLIFSSYRSKFSVIFQTTMGKGSNSNLNMIDVLDMLSLLLAD
jgi:hypothetical protein